MVKLILLKRMESVTFTMNLGLPNNEVNKLAGDVMGEIKEGKYNTDGYGTGFVYKFQNKGVMNNFIDQHSGDIGPFSISQMRKTYKKEYCYRFIFDIFLMKYISVRDTEENYVRDGFKVICYGQRSE